MTGSKGQTNQWIEIDNRPELHYIVPTGKHSGNQDLQMRKPSIGSLLQNALHSKPVRVYLKGNFSCNHTKQLTDNQFLFYDMMYITDITHFDKFNILVLLTLQPCSDIRKHSLRVYQ